MEKFIYSRVPRFNKSIVGNKKLTAGMLEYVGEWHSHPEGSDCSLSPDDENVFSWLAENMFVEGLPALMLIVGDDYQWYLKDN